MRIIWFITDQHRFNLLGCGHPLVKTPHLDDLAKHGTCFRQAVCQAPMCVPSRYSFISGLYPQQTGVFTNTSYIPEDRKFITVASCFEEAGYQTAAFGKMHWMMNGLNVDKPADSRRGFQVFIARDGRHEGNYRGMSFPDYLSPEDRSYYENERRDGGDDAESYIGWNSKWNGFQHPEWWIVNRALEYLNRIGDDENFFMVISLDSPHPPSFVPADYADIYSEKDIAAAGKPPSNWINADPRDKWYIGAQKFKLSEADRRIAHARYFANVTYSDMCIGRIVDELKEKKHFDDAFIAFFSDHGDQLGDRNGYYSKYSLYEGSVRVPLIIKPPAKQYYLQGATCDEPVELVDVMLTNLVMAGINPAPYLPGYNLQPLLRGERATRRKFTFAVDCGAGFEIPMLKPTYMARTAEDKLIFRQNESSEYYRLDDDPQEWFNLYHSSKWKSRIEQLSMDIITLLNSTENRIFSGVSN